MEGIIYILINEAMPGYTKVGKTTTNVEQRMRELNEIRRAMEDGED